MKIKLLNLKKIGTLLMATLLINTISNSANFTAVTSGNWSSTTTWGGTLPSFTNTLDVITIPAGITVTLDNNLTMNGVSSELNVMGALSSPISSTYALIVTMGAITGTGSIDIGDITLGTDASMTFNGSLAVNSLTTSILSLQSAANVAVNQTLTMVAGTLSMQAGGALTMALNSDIVIVGGLLTVNGGTLDLSNNYNVSYTSISNVIAGLELSGSGLKNVTINLPSSLNTLTLSNDLRVNGILTLTNGTLMLGLSDLTIAGDVATNGNGIISSTVASDVSIISSTGITGSLNFDKIQSAVNNFTVNVGDGNHAQIKGALTVNGSLNMTSGELMLDSVYLKIIGNISATGNGTIFGTSSSAIDINTTNSPLGAMRFNAISAIRTFKVNITDGGSIKIRSNLFIQDTLKLTKGKLDIGVYYIQIGATGIITNADSNSYIITDAAGFLSMSVTSGVATALNFPIGTSTKYFPARILLNTGSASGIIGIGVIPHVYSIGNTGVELSTTQRLVDATWMVQSSIATNLNMNINVMWSASTEVNGFMRTNAYLSHFTNNQWDLTTASAAMLNTNGMYSISRNNISSLSPFAVMDNTITGINESRNDVEVGVFPNPITDIIHINNLSGSNDIMNVDLMDISGHIVASYKLAENNNSISLSDLNEGYYFLKVYNSKMNVVKRIIKM